MPKVTVIVPAYNVEKFIAQTLDSLLAQTLQDIEVLIINDGSTDATADIIEDYCSKHPIFKHVYQENAGVSNARNNGIPLATGEYICFLDSDDVYTPESLEGFYTAAKETDADLVIGRLKSFGAGVSAYNEYADKLAEKTVIDTYDYDLLWNFLVGNKFYKRETLVKSGVQFPQLTYSEEGAFFMSFVYTGAKITGTRGATMCYRRHTNEEGLSVSQRVNLSLIQNFIGSLTQIYEKAEESFDALSASVDREKYLQEILYKTAHILIFQFYRHFWRVDQESLAYIREQTDRLLSQMDAQTTERLKSFNSDISLTPLITDKKEMAGRAQISVLISGTDMGKTASSVFESSYPAFEVLVPKSVAGQISEKWRNCENLIVLEDGGFQAAARKRAKGKYKIRLTKPTAVDDRLLRFLVRFPAPEFAKRLGFSVLFHAALKKIS